MREKEKNDKIGPERKKDAKKDEVESPEGGQVSSEEKKEIKRLNFFPSQTEGNRRGSRIAKRRKKVGSVQSPKEDGNQVQCSLTHSTRSVVKKAASFQRRKRRYLCNIVSMIKLSLYFPSRQKVAFSTEKKNCQHECV